MLKGLFAIVCACFCIASFLFGGFTFYLAYVSLTSGWETLVFGMMVGNATTLILLGVWMMFLGFVFGFFFKVTLED